MAEIKEDIVLDETGAALDKDGNKKEKLLADYMKKADIGVMISEVTASVAEAGAAVDKLTLGSGLSEAIDGLKRLTAVTTGGSHMDFARKNAWIADAAQRNAYLTSGVDQGIADKQYIIDFYKLVVETSDFRADFVKLLNMLAGETLLTIYQAIHFEKLMTELVTFNQMDTLHSAFVEFDVLYRKLNDAGIYDQIPVSKSKYSAEENLEMVLDYMDEAICKKDHLGKFLVNASNASPAALNQLYIFDRETREFDKFASREGNLQRAIDACSELNSKLAGGYAVAAEGQTAYLDAFRIFLEKVVAVTQTALDVINAFRTNKDKVPYSIMHYDVFVVAAVNQNSLGTLTDPLTQGTNYRAMAKTMVSRFQSLAATVAKHAPA